MREEIFAGVRAGAGGYLRVHRTKCSLKGSKSDSVFSAEQATGCGEATGFLNCHRDFKHVSKSSNCHEDS